MANLVKHKKTSTKPAPSDSSRIGGPDWNDEHVFTGGATGSLLIRDTGQSDGANWQTKPHVDVRDLGATGNGTTNDAPFFLAAYNALPSTGGVIYLPPAPVEYKISGTGATTSNLIKVVPIIKNNVYIVGSGRASTVYMADFTVAQANAQNDAGVGVDIFTVFAFIGVTHGGVRDVHFRGEWDATTAHTASRARAKGVGITDCSHITATRVSGSRLVGNVVNARSASTDGTTYISVTESIAQECSENGFNYMGGTADCLFANNRSFGNGAQGFESGTKRVTCRGNICRGNKNGISQVATHGVFADNILEGNIVSGFNFQYNDATYNASYNLLRGNVIRGNLLVGVLGNGSSTYNVIDGNYIADNNSVDFSAGEGIKLASVTDRYTIRNNFIGDTRATPRQIYGINAIAATNLVVQNNRVERNTTLQIYADTGDTHWYMGNKGTVTLGGTTNAYVFTSSDIGAFTSNSATGGLGYSTGAGGTVTQATSKSTGVTLNKVTGEITMHGAALAADTSVPFTLTNSAIAAGDYVQVQHVSAGTAGAYTCTGLAAGGSATITVRNVTPGPLSEAIVLKFLLIKSVTA